MNTDGNGKRPTVLVADDNRIARQALCRMLQKEGYRVLEAEDGLEALQRAEESRPDLILLDLGMPELDGYGVCRTLRRSHETRLIPIIIVTAASDLESRVRSYNLDADDFLVKPVHGVELSARIRSLMRLRQAVEEQLRERELRARLEKELALTRLRQEEQQRRSLLYREVLYAVTGGKLCMVSPEEMKEKIERLDVRHRLELSGPEGVSQARHLALEFCLEQAMSQERADDLVVCVSEAATNIIKHSGHGRVELALRGSQVAALFLDEGPGFKIDQLARCTLMRGYSTTTSMGMGFSMMLEFLDEIYLQTDRSGTRLLLLQGIQAVEPSLEAILSAFPSL
ncbi:MAG: response regulator [Armatimonadetes bacterium]|nr:response regulator [Armatimonadota bacterium]